MPRIGGCVDGARGVGVKHADGPMDRAARHWASGVRGTSFSSCCCQDVALASAIAEMDVSVAARVPVLVVQQNRNTCG